jgi:signal transduction histidine kinase
VPEVAIWSLRRRLAVAIVVLASILALLVAAAISLLLAVRSQQRAVIDRYFTAVGLSNHRFTEQIDAETAIRGYALTGFPGSLKPSAAVRSPTYAADAARIRGLIGNHPDVAARFLEWDAAERSWWDRWARPTITEIDRRGPRSVSPGEVLRGKQLFDTVRARYDEFSTALVAERNGASDSLRLRTDLLFLGVLLVTAALAAAGAFAWWSLRRWVIGPLSALGAETRLVRAGALDHEVGAGGPREIQELATAVEEMRRDIVAKLEAVERARTEIEAARETVEAQAAELVRSNRDLEQFAYVASHDLQEPLRKVASFCQMLERRYAGQLDERADQYINFAVDGAKRMQQLINDLLAFSRVGRFDAPTTVIDLQVCLEDAIANLAAAIEEHDAVIDAEPMPPVLGQASLLTQLFQNLIGNAIKFRAEAAPRVRLSVRRNGAFWQFACADNGLGIESQYAERIFVIFQRLHGKDEYAGTGIGLALCKRIVEHHGGRIWLDTEVRSGTTIRWTLPAHADSIDDPEPSLEHP